MRFLDLLSMSVNNLRCRKLRTVLTVLGVVIGAAPIVVTVSLGIGLKELIMELYSSYGNMTSINVYFAGGGRYGMISESGSSKSSSSEFQYLTDDAVKQLERLPHVKYASPMLSTNVILRQGAYETGLNITGVSRQYMEQMLFGQGKLPEPDSTELQLTYGNGVLQWLSNPKTGVGYWETGVLPEVDYMSKPMFVVFDINAYYQTQGGNTDSNVEPPKKYMIPAAGVVEGGVDDYNMYSYSVYADTDVLKAQLKKIYKKNPTPRQPTNEKGKPYNYSIHDQAVVFADDMNNVTDLQKQLNDMGYQANSQMEWVEQPQQQSDMTQVVSGGISAVFMLAATISITNAMTMSIYERIKEIGVIEALGCDMRAVRDMFLVESGSIGFMGGVIGMGLSYTISYVMDKFLAPNQMTVGVEGDISRIPSWLRLSATGLTILVGMATGFFPSLRTMKLNPLTAIRNE